MEIDRKNGNTRWKDATDLETSQLDDYNTFKDYGHKDKAEAPKGYTKIRGHFVYDCKHDGRAGGYAGFDDDEFEELGGTQGPSRQARGSAQGNPTSNHKKRKGFEIGAHLQEQEDQLQSSDLFAGLSGKAVSLQMSQADAAAADYMTLEEDERLLEQQKKERTKFKKKKKKDKKKDKKKSKRQRQQEESDEEEESLPQPQQTAAATTMSKGLAEELEATAEVSNTGTSVSRRKRRREEEDNDEQQRSSGIKGPSIRTGGVAR